MGRAAAHGPDTAVSLDRIVMTELTANFTLTGHRFVGNSNQGAWSLTVQAVRFGPRSNEYAQPPEPRHRPGVAIDINTDERVIVVVDAEEFVRAANALWEIGRPLASVGLSRQPSGDVVSRRECAEVSPLVVLSGLVQWIAHRVPAMWAAQKK